MWCLKCDKDLRDCECPDLMERLKGLADHNVIVSPQVIRHAREVEGERELKNTGKDES